MTEVIDQSFVYLLVYVSKSKDGEEGVKTVRTIIPKNVKSKNKNSILL